MKTKIIFLIATLAMTLVSCGNKKSGDILFQDDFSKSGNLKNWQIIDCKDASQGPSDWKIKDGELFQSSNIYRGGDKEYDMYEGTMAITKEGKNWKNYEFSSDFRITGDDDGVGVIFRYQDPEHFYRFITVDDPGNNGPFCRLQAKDGDKYITLAENSKGYDSSKPHNVKITANGNELTVYFDGQKILSAKDNRYKSGKIGLMCYAEQPAFDNILVKKID